MLNIESITINTYSLVAVAIPLRFAPFCLSFAVNQKNKKGFQITADIAMTWAIKGHKNG